MVVSVTALCAEGAVPGTHLDAVGKVGLHELVFIQTLEADSRASDGSAFCGRHLHAGAFLLHHGGGADGVHAAVHDPHLIR